MIPQIILSCAILAAVSGNPYLPGPVVYAKAPVVPYAYKAPLAYHAVPRAPLAYAPVVKAPLAYPAPGLHHAPLVAAPALAHVPLGYGGHLGHGLYGHGPAVYAPRYYGAAKYGYGKVLY